MNGSIISSKKRTQVLLHSAALVSLIEGLQYKTRLVIDPKNKTKTHLCIQKHGFPPSNLGGKKERLESAFLHNKKKTFCNIIKS